MMSGCLYVELDISYAFVRRPLEPCLVSSLVEFFISTLCLVEFHVHTLQVRLSSVVLNEHTFILSETSSLLYNIFPAGGTSMKTNCPEEG